MKHMFQRAAMIGVLLAAGGGVALAQTNTVRPVSTPAAHQMQNGTMMQNGGMMNMMMGNDPVGGCAAMMNSIAKDPVLHKRMNQIMLQAMRAQMNGKMQGMPTPSATPR